MKNMKGFAFLILAAALLVAGCSAKEDKPTENDVRMVLQSVNLSSMTIDKMEFAGNNDFYSVGVVGVARDKGEELNIFTLIVFHKENGKWAGKIPGSGMYGEPVSEKSKKAFQAEMLKEWEKVKQAVVEHEGE